jgi:hypothetical protein
MDHMSRYSIVQVFSPARADTSDSKPLLFLQDSIIRLSELQVLRQPATRLVFLSACQTNVGKNATGEGIYSLTRGFASMGILSVVATLRWPMNIVRIPCRNIFINTFHRAWKRTRHCKRQNSIFYGKTAAMRRSCLTTGQI